MLPDVTVLLTGVVTSDGLAASLDSLLAQTLAAERFEVLVVHHPSASEVVREVVDARRSTRPTHVVRALETDTRGTDLREAGALAARGRQLTVVSSGDEVAPDHLEVLLETSSPGVVPLVVPLVMPPEPDASPDPARRRLLEHAGETIPGTAVPTVLTRPVGKLVPTGWAVAPLPEASFWAELQARTGFRFGVPGSGGESYREAGSSPSYENRVAPLLEEVAALRGIPSSDGAARRVARSVERAHAVRINDYLRGAPDDHSRVVADVRRLGIQRFPWSVVNRGLARDLAISYCFPPFQDTSGNVAARRLRERGVVVDVVRADVSRLRKEDPASLLVPAEVVDETRVVPGAASFGLWSTIARWVDRAEQHVVELERQKGPYRSLYSRAMPVNSHLAAAIVSLHRPGLPWTAELSDPLKVHPNGLERVSEVNDDALFRELAAAVADAGFEVPDGVRLFEFGEVVTYALADHIVFTNENQREFMLGYCRDPRLVERVRRVSSVSHHPTLPPDFYTLVRPELELADDVVDIAYFGVFYQTRGLAEVTSALEQLPPDVRRRVRLHVFTNRDDHLEIAKFASDLADVVRLHAFVPFLEFLNLTTRFDVLLVNDAETTPYLGINPYLPSKLSDYRGSGTPVWAVAEPGSVLDGAGTEYHSRLGDVAGAVAALRQIVNHRFAGESR